MGCQHPKKSVERDVWCSECGAFRESGRAFWKQPIKMQSFEDKPGDIRLPVSAAEFELIRALRAFPRELQMCKVLGVRSVWSRNGMAVYEAFRSYAMERGETF